MLRHLPAVAVVLFAVLAFAGGIWTARSWWPLAEQHADHTEPAAKPLLPGEQPAKLSLQAQKNLGLKALRLVPTTYWRTIEVPGVVEDRPGISDRGVVSPVTGVVTRIHSYPGDTVEPNGPLFSIRLVSESLHASQLELFKASREIEIAQEQSKRLGVATQSGALPQVRVIEVENQIRRLEATVQAYQQDLLSRGLPNERVAAAAKGEFVTEILIRAPGEQILKFTEIALTTAQQLLENEAPAAEVENNEPRPLPFNFELTDLQVTLGQQVEAGQVLCQLADHRALFIEGRGFKEDMALIQEAARNRTEIEVEYEALATANWPPFPKTQYIHHVANTIDRESRTFGFYLPLENQWKAYTHEGQTRLLWRFRPGDRVRLHVAVEKLENVFVLPQEAVVREGPEAYVFRQNGELFDRRPVHVLYEDRRHTVVANDGSLRAGQYVANSGAASINRVMKSQAASGQPTGMHVHADGTVHGAH